jgi:hypothetical protein
MNGKSNLINRVVFDNQNMEKIIELPDDKYEREARRSIYQVYSEEDDPVPRLEKQHGRSDINVEPNIEKRKTKLEEITDMNEHLTEPLEKEFLIQLNNPLLRKNKNSKHIVNKEFMSLKDKDNKGKYNKDKYNIYSIKRPSRAGKSKSKGSKKRTINKRKTRKIQKNKNKK